MVLSRLYIPLQVQCNYGRCHKAIFSTLNKPLWCLVSLQTSSAPIHPSFPKRILSMDRYVQLCSGMNVNTTHNIGNNPYLLSPSLQPKDLRPNNSFTMITTLCLSNLFLSLYFNLYMFNHVFTYAYHLYI